MKYRTRKTIGTRLHKVYSFLWDGMYNSLPERLAYSKAITWVSEAALWTLCFIYKHEPIPDQCGMPAHEYCEWCHRPMPFAWTNSQKPSANDVG